MMSISFAFISLLLVVFSLVIPLLVGVFVYRDAKIHGMSPLLWALVAALAPTFLGIIVYLLVRSNHPALRCPRCDSPVQERFTVCPQCGAQLKAACSHCGAGVEPGWKVCPNCATPLDWEAQQVIPPVQVRDKGIGKILLVIILIPLLLLVLLFVNFAPVDLEHSIVSSHASFYTEIIGDIMGDHLGLTEEMQELKQKTQENNSTAYALTGHTTVENGISVYSYLVYLPHADLESVTSSHESAFLGTNLMVDYNVSPTAERGVYVAVMVLSDREPHLKVTRDGKKIRTHLTKTSSDLHLAVEGQGGASSYRQSHQTSFPWHDDISENVEMIHD